MTGPDADFVVHLRGPLALGLTLGPLAHGRGDRTVRIGTAQVQLALRTDDGPLALQLDRVAPDRLRVRAWGGGARRAAELVPRLVGEEDDPDGLVAHHPIIRRLQRTHRGLRLPQTRRVFHALVPAILEQKITGTEAFRAYAALLRTFGEPAPGPLDLLLPPDPGHLARTPYHAFHPIGLERRRAEVIRRAASVASWLEASETAAIATERLRSVRGIGAWTAAEVTRVAYGDPDAVSVGDYHIPNSVAWALAGEPRADDERMLELLEPYRGQRGRVQRLLEVGRITAPRYGPRMAPRRIAAI